MKQKLLTFLFCLISFCTLALGQGTLCTKCGKPIKACICKPKPTPVTKPEVLTYTITKDDRSMCEIDEKGNLIIPRSITKGGKTYIVTRIGNHAFEFCKNLTSITIPNSITCIGGYAFDGCSGLTSVTIPNSVTSIGNYAFYGCSGLTSVTIGNGVTFIGKCGFLICKNLTLVNITDLSAWCKIQFEDSSSNPLDYAHNLYLNGKLITDLVIPNGVTNIADYTFSNCTSITSVTIPNFVTSIGSYAFTHCSGMTSITIPNSVTSIGRGAFIGCSDLSSITIPNSVTIIGEYAFMACNSLSKISVDKGNPVYDSRDNCNAIIKTKNNMLISGCKNTIIPNSVTTIGERAFDECRNLTSINIPNSVTTIGKGAFEDCSDLTSINCHTILPPLTEGYLGFYKKVTIHVPRGCANAYKQAKYWKDYAIIDDL